MIRRLWDIVWMIRFAIQNNPLLSSEIPRWRQSLMRLTRIVTIETRRRLVLIPSRMDAENERDRLKREHGAAMIAAKISQQVKGATRTYPRACTISDTRTEELF